MVPIGAAAPSPFRAGGPYPAPWSAPAPRVSGSDLSRPLPSPYREAMAASLPPLRRELLLSFAILFVGALLLAALVLLTVVPWLEDPGEGIVFLLLLLGGDLLVLFLFGRDLLDRTVLKPVGRVAGSALRIAGGDYHHRVGAEETLELSQLAEGVNRMADRLIRDQALLAENVRSLERTNRELSEVRAEAATASRLATVGGLAAGIAHEVGNPLGALLGFVDVARRRAEADPEQEELLEMIREEALRIDRIVRGLLDFARPSAGGADLESPSRALERVRALLASQGRLGGVEDVWEVARDVEELGVDGRRLEHVLLNLLLNAIDALDETGGGRIVVAASREAGDEPGPIRREDDPPGVNYAHRRRRGREPAETRLDLARDVLRITVADDGPGIPPDDLDRVFDPFYTTKDPGRGTGLGLAVCARLVEGLGGRIEAATSREGGASFTVRIPATEGRRPADVPESVRTSAVREGA